MTSVAPGAQRSLGPRPTAGPKPRFAGGRLKPIVIIGLLALFFILLAVAETSWLHTALPQDRVSRISLAAFPDDRLGQTVDSGAATRDVWVARLTAIASSAAVLDAVDAQLGLGQPGRPQPAAESELRKQLRTNTLCIQTTSAAGRPVQGVLLVTTVRGSDEAEVEAFARAWSTQFVKVSAVEIPELVVTPTEALSVPYEACRS